MYPNGFFYGLIILAAVLFVGGSVQAFGLSRAIRRRRRSRIARPVLVDLVVELSNAARRLDALTERVETLIQQRTGDKSLPVPHPSNETQAAPLGDATSPTISSAAEPAAVAQVAWPAKPPAAAAAVRQVPFNPPKLVVSAKATRRAELEPPPLDDLEHGKIVVHYIGGRILKGFTYDFYPNKSCFHVMSATCGVGGKATEVWVKDLKGVFFVRDFGGNPHYVERKEFLEGERPPGRKVEVTFKDGEVLVGSTVGYDPRRPGFFLIPVDPKSNNLKVFVVSSAVNNVRFL